MSEKDKAIQDVGHIREYIYTVGNIGFGNDPVGFLLASHELVVHERNRMREALEEIAKHTSYLSEWTLELEPTRSALVAKKALLGDTSVHGDVIDKLRRLDSAWLDDLYSGKESFRQILKEALHMLGDGE